MNEFNIKRNKDNWRLFRFDEIAYNISERVEPKETNLEIYVGLEHIDSEDIHIRRKGIPADVEGTKLKVYKGDIIFGRRRAYQRKAAIADFDGICSAHALVLRAKENVITPQLLPFFLHSNYFMHRAVKISVGSLSPTINWGTLKEQKFLLPPLKDQEQIAKLFWSADTTIECYSRMRDIILAIGHKMNYKHSGTEFIKKKLGSVLVPKKEISIPPHKKVKYVGLEQVQSGDFTCENYISSSAAQSNCFIFDKGDLLYSKLRPYLDKAFISDFSGVCTTELLVYDVKNADKEFILQVLHSPQFINYVNSKSFGTKMPRVSHEIICGYDTYLPDIKEQIIIKKEFQQIRESVKNISVIIQGLKRTLHELLNAFWLVN